MENMTLKYSIIFIAFVFSTIFGLGSLIEDVNKVESYPYSIDGIGYDTTYPMVEVDKENFENIDSLNRIVRALYLYENENYAFPLSDGHGKNWSTPVNNDSPWIKGLVPKYIKSLPQDKDRSNQLYRNFLYFSNGIDFKLIAHKPGDCTTVKKKYDGLIDPKRGNECHAYGYWTKNARMR